MPPLASECPADAPDTDARVTCLPRAPPLHVQWRAARRSLGCQCGTRPPNVTANLVPLRRPEGPPAARRTCACCRTPSPCTSQHAAHDSTTPLTCSLGSHMARRRRAIASASPAGHAARVRRAQSVRCLPRTLLDRATPEGGIIQMRYPCICSETLSNRPRGPQTLSRARKQLLHTTDLSSNLPRVMQRLPLRLVHVEHGRPPRALDSVGPLQH